EMSVAVVVPCVDTHPGLRPAIAAQCDAGFQAFLSKGAIPIVMKQQVGGGVVPDVDVGPAVVVQISKQHAKSVVSRVLDAGRLSDVCKGAVTVIVVEHVGFAGEVHGTTKHGQRHVPAALASFRNLSL